MTMADEKDGSTASDTVERAAQSAAPAGVEVGEPAKEEIKKEENPNDATDDQKVKHVTKEEFDSFKGEVTTKLDDVLSAVTNSADDVNPLRDESPKGLPWTHRKFGRRN